ncbi:hypothetical protein [Embleya hyalina]|nr:hypothetical protein [Embleya hyalina]
MKRYIESLDSIEWDQVSLYWDDLSDLQASAEKAAVIDSPAGRHVALSRIYVDAYDRSTLYPADERTSAHCGLVQAVGAIYQDALRRHRAGVTASDAA